MKLLCSTRDYVSSQSLTLNYGKINKQCENQTGGPLLLKKKLINPKQNRSKKKKKTNQPTETTGIPVLTFNTY